MPNIYYVGSGGNDGNNGTTWALRKATLNGAENIPVAAGDTVYVGPGIYRELLTCDVSGAGGSPITYIGDYLGTNTDGVGGVIRITGSDNDQTATRASCITCGAQRNYRTFQGFVFDGATSYLVFSGTGLAGTNWIIQRCSFEGSLHIYVDGANQAAWTIQNCYFGNVTTGVYAVTFTHSATVDNTSHLVQNCIFNNGAGRGIASARVGGIVVKNCYLCSTYGVRVVTALNAGQTLTVNNCIFYGCANALTATATGEFSEDYNNLYLNATDRTNVTAGANSIAYIPSLDKRWMMQIVMAGAGPSSALQVISPFDLASYSQLINVAGTSPTTTDMRGTAAIGGQREWGALEYDSTLQIEGGAGTGGAVSISPSLGSVGAA